jgi:DNA-binding CsgD family transcriptional regulator
VSSDRVERLTDRQRDCLMLVAQGYTSKEIGRLLELSPSTVDNHILAAVQTLDAPSRAAAGRILATHADGQKLPSQSESLVEHSFSATVPSDAPTWSWSRLGRQALTLPPIGGQRNELDWTEKTIRIIHIATVSLAMVVTLALVVAGVIKAFS